MHISSEPNQQKYNHELCRL